MITPIKQWVASLEISHLQKCVLMALADHAGPDCTCWPSNKHLQDWTGLKERAIRNGIHELRDAGLLTIDEQEGFVSEYRLAFPPGFTPARRAGVGRRHPGTTGQEGAAFHAPVAPAHHAGGSEHIPSPTPAPDAAPSASHAAPPAPRAPELSNLGKISLVSNGEGAPAAPAPRPKLTLVEHAPKPKAEPRAHRLPEDWQPSQEDAAYAVQLGLDPVRTAQDFRDHWHTKGGKDARKTDWGRTWQVWCRKDHDWGKHLPKGGGVRAHRRSEPAAKYDWFGRGSDFDQRDDFVPSDKPILDLAAGDWR